VATGVALAEATGDGLMLGSTLAKTRLGLARFKAKTTKNNRKISFAHGKLVRVLSLYQITSKIALKWEREPETDTNQIFYNHGGSRKHFKGHHVDGRFSDNTDLPIAVIDAAANAIAVEGLGIVSELKPEDKPSLSLLKLE